MTVIKRSNETTKKDLLTALERFTEMLKDHEEDDAIADLREAASLLKSSSEGSPELRKAASMIIDAFEGDHELIAYTFQRDTEEWTEIEELSQTSARVLSLARRLK